MITLTIVEKDTSKKTETFKRKLRMFHSIDKAKKFIVPIVKEMKQAIKEKRPAKTKIDAVSYDTKSEKTLLLELDAITSIENENDDNGIY